VSAAQATAAPGTLMTEEAAAIGAVPVATASGVLVTEEAQR